MNGTLIMMRIEMCAEWDTKSILKEDVITCKLQIIIYSSCKDDLILKHHDACHLMMYKSTTWGLPELLMRIPESTFLVW